MPYSFANRYSSFRKYITLMIRKQSFLLGKEYFPYIRPLFNEILIQSFNDTLIVIYINITYDSK